MEPVPDYEYGGSEQENAELLRLELELRVDPDDYGTWEQLVSVAESLEGGINRNSNPQAITTARRIYDKFLAKFPLFFAYWKKYADMEFATTGTEAAEMVYERGIASIPMSVDLWANYCSFKAETSHDPVIIRDFYLAVSSRPRQRYECLLVHIALDKLPILLSLPCPSLISPRCPDADPKLNRLFERALAVVGHDFYGHDLWDKYIVYEERLEAHDKIFAILARVIHVPMHQYARYFERYRHMAQLRPLAELAPKDVLTQLRAEVETMFAQVGGKSEAEIEHELRLRLDAQVLETFHKTQAEVNSRWAFESEIKRPYFHVTELDEAQLVNWRKYLDFEESEGSFDRIRFLYERCLVTCAFHEEFWLRYARWMTAQPDKEEEVRLIYQRAVCIFVPIALPTIRLHYAYFEEMVGRTEVAKEIHLGILINMPSHVETIVSLANLSRRHGGLDAAIEVYKTQLNSPEVDMGTKAALVAEWARLLWKIKGAPEEARQVFEENKQYYLDSRPFWSSYLKLEIEQPTSAETESKAYERIKGVISDVRSKSTLPPEAVKELVELYMTYLLERGTADSAKEYITLDREIHGPASIALVRTGGHYAYSPAAADLISSQQPAADPAAAQAYAYYQQEGALNGAPQA
ncbi:hypothetical protein N7468_006564 [Penicillium chermesinum]|uniref:Pre-mRNA-processing factor 39 n=1 Tax=Penicillium chermesinum TaxID=63820 RepID=A0A9W9NVA1_9EURO|nr:uncharacterized protein N7468_006564 [Penicillium chermesinum]KAJ5225339.1 hypothetical protein N7468_006564 [Penicillium chermesinum]